MKPRRHVMNNKGFSIIELMIASMLIMISMLALLTSMLMGMNANRGNEIRNTAITVANQTAEALLALPIEDAELSISASHSRIDGDAAQRDKGFPEVSQKIRGFYLSYTVQWTVSALSSNLKQVNISVSYTNRNNPYTYSAVVYKHRAI